MREPAELFDLEGRVAVVTGASSGLGAQLAWALAGAGQHHPGSVLERILRVPVVGKVDPGADQLAGEVAADEHQAEGE